MCRSTGTTLRRKPKQIFEKPLLFLSEPTKNKRRQEDFSSDSEAFIFLKIKIKISVDCIHNLGNCSRLAMEFVVNSDAKTRATASDALVSKHAAARLGYFKDDYVEYFCSGSSVRRPPIINRGISCYLCTALRIRHLILCRLCP